MRVLVVNAGSSSLKLSLLGPGDELMGAEELPAGADPAAALDALGEADATGHRVVHGGERFRAAVRVDDEVRAALEALTELAPLHQPKSLAALDAVSAARPDLPAVACFDTAFHATLEPEAALYPLPRAWRERWPLRRYGFHGLSHAWAARRAADLVRAPRIVTCHLGAGASLAAVRDGRSVDTTMGFTPLEGLAMATRSGSVDPGLVLWLIENQGLAPAEVAHALEHESGLLGLAGTADMRELLERDDDDARLALAVYVHRVAAGVAAMAASLGGVDGIVFTGGVGERSAAIRARVIERLGFLGAELDSEANEQIEDDGDVAAYASTVRVVVVKAREDLEIARQARALWHKGQTPF